MGLVLGQWSVAGTVPVFTVPPAAATVTLYQSGTTPVWLGMGTALTTTNGMSVSTTPVTFRLAPGSAGRSCTRRAAPAPPPPQSPT